MTISSNAYDIMSLYNMLYVYIGAVDSPEEVLPGADLVERDEHQRLQGHSGGQITTQAERHPQQ